MGSHVPGSTTTSASTSRTCCTPRPPTRPLRSTHLKGITRKLVYAQTSAPLLNEDASHYMVKPYHERVSRRLKSWMQYPIQGWAEMANQGLYHAAGIGRLHQKVHIDEHDMGEGHEREPALVVHMQPGFQTMGSADPEALRAGIIKNPEMVEDARKIALMDFLTNNLDRHTGNLLFHPDGKLLAIDHSRSFQYKSKHKWGQPVAETRYGKLDDSLRNYVGADPMVRIRAQVPGIQDGGTMPWSDDKRVWHDSELWEPALDWWGKASKNVRERMAHELKHIKSDIVRKHVQRNFNARANLLDQMAQFGPGNFGHYDWHHTTVPIHRPNEKAEGEV
jgi:hypothetical protein